MENNYNSIFSELVEDDSDVIGHIAYSLYKADKLKFICEYKDKHNGAEPTAESLSSFKEYTLMESHIVWYKMQAVEILKNFVDDTLSETLKQLEEDYIRTQDQRLKAIVEPLIPEKTGWSEKYGHGIVQSVLGAFFFALLVAAFAFIKSYSVDESSVFSLINITKTVPSDQKNADDCEKNDSTVVLQNNYR